MNASEFIGILFLARDVTHSVHLQTKNYATHKALNEFYDEIIDLADNFAETYQGRHGLIGPIQLAKTEPSLDVIKFLRAQLAMIENERGTICSADDSPLQNLIDEICERYLRTLYKLENLR